ncbi:MAG: uracil-DNA glycosylase family protein, partial [Bacteroidales bacterium]|nr:uracil-DNA glycosylase family protein [Bacteroidales bacterium]
RFDEGAIRTFCTREGLAFYDTATEVKRLKDNASDAFLEVVTPTDIRALLARIPECHTVVTTGEKASGIVAETFGCRVPSVGEYIEIPDQVRNEEKTVRNEEKTVRNEVILWRMPSTSRAYPLSLEKKAEAYRKLFL